MMIRMGIWAFGSLVGTTLTWGVLLAGEKTASLPSDQNTQVARTTVEFFQGMKDGTIDVKFIPKNASQARVMITNKTNQPVQIQLPEAFAGVPILAQFGGGGNVGGGGGNNFGGGSQGMGGGMGGGGMGGMGGGMFNVEPEQTRKISVNTVCLDHGKPDPNPRIPYEIKPIESYVDRADVIELIKAFGRGEIHPGTAQAAAWHLNNDISWQELKNKMRGPKDPRFGPQSPYFSAYELQSAMSVAQEARRLAKESETDPGKLNSMSR